MKNAKKKLPWFWVFGAMIILATNNLVSFITYVKTGDSLVIISLLFILGFSIYNLDFVRELR